MSKIEEIKKELKALSKNRLLKLRADVNDDIKRGDVDTWKRINCNCDCDYCDVLNACNYTEGHESEERLPWLRDEIKTEIARR